MLRVDSERERVCVCVCVSERGKERERERERERVRERERLITSGSTPTVIASPGSIPKSEMTCSICGVVGFKI